MDDTRKRELTDRFDELLRSTGRSGVENLISYLHSTDFYEAPASTRFHSSYEGGLIQHSLNVFDMLEQKFENKPWSNFEIKRDTLIIVALCHDICKANYYGVEMRNRKNEHGVWEKYPFYIVDDKSPYGHGEKSAMITSNFIKLSAEERYAIRWHMGFSESKENYNYVGKAMELYPLVIAAHEADLEATYLMESEHENEE